MKGKHHSADEIVKVLDDVTKRMEAGERVEELCRQLEISVGTFWRWRARYGGIRGNELQRLKIRWTQERSVTASAPGQT